MTSSTWSAEAIGGGSRRNSTDGGGVSSADAQAPKAGSAPRPPRKERRVSGSRIRCMCLPLAVPIVGCTGTRSPARSDSESFLQLPRHPAAHLQRRLATAQPHEVLTVGSALDALEVFNAHQRVAVDAYERRAELALQQPQRILDQILAVQVTDGGVFLIGEEVLHLFDGDQPQTLAMPR